MSTSRPGAAGTVGAGVRRTLSRIVPPGALAACATGFLLLFLTLLASSSTLGAYTALFLALLVLVLLVLGIRRGAEAIIVLGVLLVPMTNLKPSAGGLSFVTASDAAFALGFGLLFPYLLQCPLRLPPVFGFGAVGAAAVALISSMASVEPLLSLNGSARLLVGAFGLVTLFVWWNPDVKKVVTIAWAYVIGNVISVVYAFTGTSTVSGRRFGLTEHPNFFGLTSLLGLAVIPFLVARSPRPARSLLAVFAFLCFVGIWTSGSRGALLAILMVGLAYPLLSRSVTAALGLFAALAAVLAFSDRILSESSGGNALGRLLGNNSEGADLAREQLAENALDLFLTHPLVGVGLARALEAHIIYLQIAAGLGVIGLAFFVVALSATAAPVVTAARPFNLLALPALAYVLVGFVTPALWDRFIWVALALPLLASRLAAAEDGEPDELERQPDQIPSRSSSRHALVR